MLANSYRLYIEDQNGRLLGPASLIRADNDEAAIADSMKLANGFYAELRDDERLIKTFNENSKKRPA